MHEAAKGLIRVHKASTQNQKLRTKTSKISMSRRDNRKSCHSDQYLTVRQIPFPTVSPTDIKVLHDAAEGAMRATARVRRQSHEIESTADFLAKYWQIVTAFQTARMLAQSL